MTLGDLRDGDTAVVTVREGPEPFTSDYADPGEENDALRVPVEFHAADYDYETEDGEAFADGDHVTLITWSNRFIRALASYDDEVDGDLVGDRVEIQKFGRGYDVQYRVVAADE